MITNADYMQIVSEAYDLSDPYIKKKVIFCNEAKRQENIENIVGRLYTHIKNDVTGIDLVLFLDLRELLLRLIIIMVLLIVLIAFMIWLRAIISLLKCR